VVTRDPLHQVDLRDAEGVLQRPRRTGRHDVGVDSNRGHGVASPLISSTMMTGVHCALHRDAARLAPRPAGRDRPPRLSCAPSTLTAEVARDPARTSGESMCRRTHRGRAPTRTSRLGRRDADRAVHRIHRQLDLARRVPGGMKRQVRRARSSCHSTHLGQRAAAGVAVRCVEVSAPKSGTVVETAQSRAGSIDTKCTATVSPGSAALDVEGAGLRVSGMGTDRPRKDQVVRRLHPTGERRPRCRPRPRCRAVIRATGGHAPKVHAYSHPAAGVTDSTGRSPVIRSSDPRPSGGRRIVEYRPCVRGVGHEGIRAQRLGSPSPGRRSRRPCTVSSCCMIGW